MKRIILLALIMLVGHSASGQLITHRNIVDDGYNFWVSLPDGCTPTDSTKIPAVLFLHGRSLCGSNLNTVLRYGPLDALKYSGVDIPAVIIAPQNPGSSWNPRKLMNILEWTEDHYPVDTNRVYVIGMSLGGYGTIDFSGTYPDKVAAAMALCGGGTLKDYSGLNEVPLWIIHGYADRAVAWKESQKVVDAMVAAGDTTKLRCNFLSGVDHGKLARCFYMQKTYDWLFSHSLQDSTRTVNREYSMDAESLDSAYRQFHGQPKRTLSVKSYNGQTGAITASNESATAQDGDAKYITIREGDCLSKIAQREHTTVSKLCALNGIKETTIIRAGKKLRVR